MNAPQRLAPDTGHAEIDNLIRIIASGSLDNDGGSHAIALLHQLATEVIGPGDFETWKEAAIAERLQRIAAERRADALEISQQEAFAAGVEHAAKAVATADKGYTRGIFNGEMIGDPTGEWLHRDDAEDAARKSVPVPSKTLGKVTEILKNAERYLHLRNHCYRMKYPNSPVIDHAMHVQFTVSGVWRDNMDPRVLDGCLDSEIGRRVAKQAATAENWFGSLPRAGVNARGERSSGEGQGV